MNMKSILFLLVALTAATSLAAKIVTERVPYDHDGVKLMGTLVYDDEKTALGPQPGVLVIHEWWGREEFANKQADRLAREGYVAFALDMYGTGIATRDAKEARELAGQFYGSPLMVERARAGLDQLLATGLVDEGRVAAVGYCFGGVVAQSLAYSGAPLAGMVSVHGGVIAASAEAAARNQAKFLICHGGADRFVPNEQVDGFLLSLEDGGIDYQFIVYQGAQHAFSNEASDEYAALNHLEGVKYQRRAATRSWEHTKLFLDEIFR